MSAREPGAADVTFAAAIVARAYARFLAADHPRRGDCNPNVRAMLQGSGSDGCPGWGRVLARSRSPSLGREGAVRGVPLADTDSGGDRMIVSWRDPAGKRLWYGIRGTMSYRSATLVSRPLRAVATALTSDEPEVSTDIRMALQGYEGVPLIDKCVAAIAADVERQGAGGTVWLAGHSLGGSVALRAAHALTSTGLVPAGRVRVIAFAPFVREPAKYLSGNAFVYAYANDYVYHNGVFPGGEERREARGLPSMAPGRSKGVGRSHLLSCIWSGAAGLLRAGRRRAREPSAAPGKRKLLRDKKGPR